MSNEDYTVIDSIKYFNHNVVRSNNKFIVETYINNKKIVKGIFENEREALLLATILDKGIKISKKNSIFKYKDLFYVYNPFFLNIQFIGSFYVFKDAKRKLDEKLEIDFKTNHGEVIPSNDKFGVFNGTQLFGFFDKLNIANMVRVQLKRKNWNINEFIECRVFENNHGYFALKNNGNLIEFIGYKSSKEEVEKEFNNFDGYEWEYVKYDNINSFESKMCINTIDDLLSPKCYDKLCNVEVSVNDYHDVLGEILIQGKESINFNENNLLFDKMSNIVNGYLLWSYKSKGASYGHYKANHIFLDDRLSISQKSSTLIHELTHHLVAEIFENLLCKWLNVEKTQIIEGFVEFCLFLPPYMIFQEYCAHTVEGRFIPIGHQNYASYIKAMQDFDEMEDKEIFTIMGNTVANDIIKILEHFIDENMREEIRIQFIKDSEEKQNDIIYESDVTCPLEEVIWFFHNAIIFCYDLLQSDKNFKELIQNHCHNFDDSYN